MTEQNENGAMSIVTLAPSRGIRSSAADRADHAARVVIAKNGDGKRLTVTVSERIARRYNMRAGMRFLVHVATDKSAIMLERSDGGYCLSRYKQREILAGDGYEKAIIAANIDPDFAATLADRIPANIDDDAIGVQSLSGTKMLVLLLQKEGGQW